MFAIMATLGSLAVRQLIKLNNTRQKLEANEILNGVNFKFRSLLNNTENALVQLSYVVNDEGEPVDFDGVAKKLMARNPQINSLQFSPEGIVKYSFPEDEKAIGFNILEHPTQKFEAQKAIVNREVVFAGPTELMQGGVAVIGRLPIFKTDTFWGFATAIIKSSDLLELSGLNKVNKESYDLCLTKYNDKTQTTEIVYGDSSMVHGNEYSGKVFFDEGSWELHVHSKTTRSYIFLLSMSIFGVVSLAFGFSLFTVRIVKRPNLLENILRQNENELNLSQYRINAVFNNSSLAIAFIDYEQDRWVNYSNSFREFFGYDEKELDQIKPLSLLREFDKVQSEWILKEIESGKLKHYNAELLLTKKDGSQSWVDLILSPLGIENDKKEIVVLIEDINEKKNKNTELEKLSNRLKAQNNKLLNFAYIVSHNLRKHTSNITGIVNLLKLEIYSKQTEGLIDKLEFSAGALNQSVYNLNDILSHSFNELNVENLNLKLEIERALKIFEEEIDLDDIRVELCESLNVEVKFNKAYLESIFYNLISNSIKYSRPDIPLELNIRTEKKSKYIRLFFQDNGIGIDLEKNGKMIFDFQGRLDKSKAGSGVGLFLTEMQIDSLDGKISVESEINKGTTFIIDFLVD